MTIENPDCVLDVLARSILMHPTLFAESCEASALEDRRYVAGRPDMPIATKRAAMARANALESAAGIARRCDSAAIAAMDIFDRPGCSWIPAFHIACKLQCLPRHVEQSFAAKEDSHA